MRYVMMYVCCMLLGQSTVLGQNEIYLYHSQKNIARVIHSTDKVLIAVGMLDREANGEPGSVFIYHPSDFQDTVKVHLKGRIRIISDSSLTLYDGREIRIESLLGIQKLSRLNQWIRTIGSGVGKMASFTGIYLTSYSLFEVIPLGFWGWAGIAAGGIVLDLVIQDEVAPRYLNGWELRVRDRNSLKPPTG